MGSEFEVTVNDSNFKGEVLDAGSLVLVDFWASWCGPCKMIAPVIEELAEEFNGKLKVCKINVDEAPKTSEGYNIMNIPSLMLFKNGEVVEKFIGVVPKNDIVTKINAHLG